MPGPTLDAAAIAASARQGLRATANGRSAMAALGEGFVEDIAANLVTLVESGNWPVLGGSDDVDWNAGTTNLPRSARFGGGAGSHSEAIDEGLLGGFERKKIRAREARQRIGDIGSVQVVSVPILSLEDASLKVDELIQDAAQGAPFDLPVAWRLWLNYLPFMGVDPNTVVAKGAYTNADSLEDMRKQMDALWVAFRKAYGVSTK